MFGAIEAGAEAAAASWYSFVSGSTKVMRLLSDPAPQHCFFYSEIAKQCCRAISGSESFRPDPVPVPVLRINHVSTVFLLINEKYTVFLYRVLKHIL
jgi:hypothetical protein